MSLGIHSEVDEQRSEVDSLWESALRPLHSHHLAGSLDDRSRQRFL
jgi:hypothetical protein